MVTGGQLRAGRLRSGQLRAGPRKLVARPARGSVVGREFGAGAGLFLLTEAMGFGGGFDFARGDAAGNVVLAYVVGGDALRAEHGSFSDADAGHDEGAVGDSGVGADFGTAVLDDAGLDGIVGVGKDSGVLGNGGALADDELAAIVEEDVVVDDDVVFKGEVVAEGELDAVVDLYVFADAFEDVLAEHGAQAEAEPVVESDGRAVEHAPEPDEGLDEGVALGVDVAVVLGLEGDVGGIEGELEDIEGELGDEGEVEASAVGAAEHELMEIVANDFAAEGDVGVAGELVVHRIDPAGEDFFGFAGGLNLAVLIAGHMS
jgi:hypothetical protein